MEFKGDIIITDPCYLIRDEHWGSDISYSGDRLEAFGFTKYIWEDTLYGDWSCTVYKGTEESTKSMRKIWTDLYIKAWSVQNSVLADPSQFEELEGNYLKSLAKFREDHKSSILGTFCADAGLVGVFYVDEVLAYNPALKESLNDSKSWFTVIKGFDGNVESLTDGEIRHLVGTGNINFYTEQSGL